MHCGRSKPGGQTDGTAIREWLITSVVDHSSLHAKIAVISPGGMWDHTGFLDGRHGDRDNAPASN